MRRWLPLLLVSLIPFVASPASAAKRQSRAERKAQAAAIEKLPDKYKAWLDEVDILITDEEVAAFLALKEDYQRDAFMKEFWGARDPFRTTARNELKDRWDANVQQARQWFGKLDDARSEVLLLNGPPAARIVSRCTTVLWPTEVWFYAGSDRLRMEFFVVFYRRWGAGSWQIWRSFDGLDALFAEGAGTSGGDRNLQTIARGCIDGDKLAGAISWVQQQGLDYDILEQRFRERPEDKSAEWVSSFASYSTDVDPAASPLPAKLEIEFPGRYQNRTVFQGVIAVPVSAATLAELHGHRSYNLLITGEILQNGELFDHFRFKFDLPADTVGSGEGESIPLIFQRLLRPGDVQLIIKLEDINSGKAIRLEKTVSVPATEHPAPNPPTSPVDSETARILAEANAALSRGETTVKILPPHGELQTGMLRFDTLTTGPIDSVTFALDARDVLTKTKPPYSVELDLGSFPRPRTLVATARDKSGAELASDELVINAATHRFKVNLLEPRKGQRYKESLLAKADVEVPEGMFLERVEFFLNETRVATLYQPPFIQPILLPKSEPLAYVRAVAFLTDGNSAERLVFVNAPEGVNFDELDIQFVELYTSVLDRQSRPVADMAQGDFTVFEDGVKQEIVRFEKVTDLPFHAAVVLDVSASMEESLDQSRKAALTFLEETIKPKDRAAVITFNDHPNLLVKFTNNVTTLAGGLAGLKAERGTALYDTIVFSLFYYSGLKGQRAMLLLSDGKDEGSRFSFDDALDYARRAGVTIYAIGLGNELEKKKLSRFADETGGRSFFIETVAELPAIYKAIEEELRSQYLIAYQSTNTSGVNEFRTIELKLGKPGLEAKTLRGYYP